MTIRSDRYTDASGAGDASTSRHLTNHDWTVIDVRTVDDESPDVVQHPSCPRCGITGWPSAIRTLEATAVCGTRWDTTTNAVVADGAPCYVIEAKNDRIEELEHLIAELRGTGCVAA